MVTLTTKIRRRDADELKAYCRLNNVTPYSLLRRYVMIWLEQQRQLWS